MDEDYVLRLNGICEEIQTLQWNARALSTTVQSNGEKLDAVLSILNRVFPSNENKEQKTENGTSSKSNASPSLVVETPKRRRNSHVTFPTNGINSADSTPVLSRDAPPIILPPELSPGMRSSKSFCVMSSDAHDVQSKERDGSATKDDSSIRPYMPMGGLTIVVKDRQKSRSMTSLANIDTKEDNIKRATSLKKLSCESGIVLVDELYVTTDDDEDYLIAGKEEEKNVNKSSEGSCRSPTLAISTQPGAISDKEDAKCNNITLPCTNSSQCDVTINVLECFTSTGEDKKLHEEVVAIKDTEDKPEETSDENNNKPTSRPISPVTEKSKVENTKKQQEEKNKEVVSQGDLSGRKDSEHSMPPAFSDSLKSSKANSCAAFVNNQEMQEGAKHIKRQLSNSSTYSAPGGILMKFGSASSQEEDDEEIKLPEMPAAAFTHRVVSVKMTQVKYFYDIKEQLGGGRFGRVYRCVDKKTGVNLAAKCFKCNKTRPVLNNLRARSLDRPKPVKIISSKRSQQEPVEKEDVSMEINILNQIDHENIVKLYDAFEYENTMTIVMEYMAGGELFARVLSDQSPLTEFDAILYMQQICKALQHMHKNLLLHLDLKPENILCLDRNSHHIKLIDFGLSRRYVPRQKIMVRWGTPEFMAPELLNYDVVTTASDMWSVGIICYILLSGLSPFLGNNDKETMQNIVDFDWEFDEEPFQVVSPEARDFISRLIVEERGGRMSAAQCLKHPWLSTPMTQSRKSLLENKQQLRRFMARVHWKAGVAAVSAARWLFTKKSKGSEEETSL